MLIDVGVERVINYCFDYICIVFVGGKFEGW